MQRMFVAVDKFTDKLIESILISTEVIGSHAMFLMESGTHGFDLL